MILTFEFGINSMDFKVEKEHRIKDVLKILNEDAGLSCELEKIAYLISRRRKQKINILYTFEEANIFNGDTLVVGK